MREIIFWACSDGRLNRDSIWYAFDLFYPRVFYKLTLDQFYNCIILSFYHFIISQFDNHTILQHVYTHVVLLICSSQDPKYKTNYIAETLLAITRSKSLYTFT